MGTVRRLQIRRGDDGFTFVEILVVIIIIGILTLIAVATFLGQREKAEKSRAISALRNAETFAVAIRAESIGYSECVDDYDREAGQNAPYTWIEDVTDNATVPATPDPVNASTDARMLSVFGPATDVPCTYPSGGPGWVTMAARAGKDCYYAALIPASNSRVRHRAAASDPADPSCEGSELTVVSADPLQLSFRGAPLAEASGW